MATIDSVADVRGARLAWTAAGDEGLPVVINAHGLMSSRASAIASSIGDYRAIPEAGSRRLVSYDARAHGESDALQDPLDLAQFTLPQLALDLLAIADLFSPGAPVSGVGLSMGTGTLLHAAVHLPGRFDRLVLTAPPTAWQTRPAQAALYTKLAETVETYRNPAEAAAALQTLLASVPVPPVFAGVEGYLGMPAVSMELLPTVLRGAAASDLPPHEALSELNHPTLILAWEGDPGHPVATALELAESLPHAELVVSSTTAEVRSWGARVAAFLH